MEITNEIKAKVFAQYLGCRILPNPKYTIPGYYKQYLDETGTYECKGSLITTGADRDLLVLKPLTSITDQDCETLVKIANKDIIFEKTYFERGEVLELHCKYKNKFILFILNDAGSIASPEDGSDFYLPAFQFLQSKGYDLPQYLLGGKTLKESGLAIYPEDLNQ